MKIRTTLETGKALFKDVDNLKRDAAQIAQDAVDHATAHADATKQRVADTIATLRGAVTDHPLALLGIGFGLGLLLGVQLGRKT